jgi:hypothetical protein
MMAAACTPSKPKVPGVASPAAVAAPAVAAVERPEAKVAGAPADAEKEKKHSHAYSPFVLKVSDGDPFRVVSFKDVGMKLSDDDAMMMYETIAESLALELGASQNLKMRSQVAYDESILDPKNHLACGSDQLYVDLWRSEGPARWGYSLWSGCGEDDNFAWKEVKVEALDTGDPIQDVKSLTSNIASTLAAATSKGCYQKTC